MKFSIVIPSYNRASSLVRTLRAINRQQYPIHSLEIIVIDNNSSDETSQVVKDFMQRSKFTCSLFFEKKQGRSYAANKGALYARSSKVIFVDDDISFEPNFISQYASCYDKFPEAPIIGGRIDISKEDKSKLSHEDLEYCGWVFGYLNHGNRVKKLRFPKIVLSGNLSVNREAMDNSLIFNTELGVRSNGLYLYGEDYLLCLKYHILKKDIIYLPDATAVNHIEDFRNNMNYKLSRFFRAGIERYIVEKELRSFDTDLHQQLGLLFQIRPFKQVPYKLAYVLGYHAGEKYYKS